MEYQVTLYNRQGRRMRQVRFGLRSSAETLIEIFKKHPRVGEISWSGPGFWGSWSATVDG